MLNFILFSILAYLLGSIPFGFLIPKMKGIDIRTIGSKATSTTNVSRALGWRWAALCGLLDLLKAAIPAYLALTYLPNQWQALFVCLMPILGHVFPIWLKFKGGKGAAPFYGAGAVLVGPKFFFILLAVWILILLIIRIMSLTNIVFAWGLCVLFYFLFPFPYFIYSICGAILITIALRENIKRLSQGVEPKIPLKW